MIKNELLKKSPLTKLQKKRKQHQKKETSFDISEELSLYTDL